MFLRCSGSYKPIYSSFHVLIGSSYPHTFVSTYQVLFKEDHLNYPINLQIAAAIYPISRYQVLFCDCNYIC